MKNKKLIDDEIFENLLKTKRINEFQELFPFASDVEKNIRNFGVGNIIKHNEKIERYFNFFPKTIDAYWQIYRRNLYHTCV